MFQTRVEEIEYLYRPRLCPATENQGGVPVWRQRRRQRAQWSVEHVSSARLQYP